MQPHHARVREEGARWLTHHEIDAGIDEGGGVADYVGERVVLRRRQAHDGDVAAGVCECPSDEAGGVAQRQHARLATVAGLDRGLQRRKPCRKVGVILRDGVYEGVGGLEAGGQRLRSISHVEGGDLREAARSGARLRQAEDLGGGRRRGGVGVVVGGGGGFGDGAAFGDERRHNGGGGNGRRGAARGGVHASNRWGHGT